MDTSNNITSTATSISTSRKRTATMMDNTSDIAGLQEIMNIQSPSHLSNLVSTWEAHLNKFAKLDDDNSSETTKEIKALFNDIKTQTDSLRNQCHTIYNDVLKQQSPPPPATTTSIPLGQPQSDLPSTPEQHTPIIQQSLASTKSPHIRPLLSYIAKTSNVQRPSGFSAPIVLKTSFGVPILYINQATKEQSPTSGTSTASGASIQPHVSNATPRTTSTNAPIVLKGAPIRPLISGLNTKTNPQATSSISTATVNTTNAIFTPIVQISSSSPTLITNTQNRLPDSISLSALSPPFNIGDPTNPAIDNDICILGYNLVEVNNVLKNHNINVSNTITTLSGITRLTTSMAYADSIYNSLRKNILLELANLSLRHPKLMECSNLSAHLACTTTPISSIEASLTNTNTSAASNDFIQTIKHKIGYDTAVSISLHLLSRLSYTPPILPMAMAGFAMIAMKAITTRDLSRLPNIDKDFSDNIDHSAYRQLLLSVNKDYNSSGKNMPINIANTKLLLRLFLHIAVCLQETKDSISEDAITKEIAHFGFLHKCMIESTMLLSSYEFVSVPIQVLECLLSFHNKRGQELLDKHLVASHLVEKIKAAKPALERQLAVQRKSSITPRIKQTNKSHLAEQYQLFARTHIEATVKAIELWVRYLIKCQLDSLPSSTPRNKKSST